MLKNKKHLENQIRNEMKYEKLIQGPPRSVEAIYAGADVWLAIFFLR